jgi:GNAT superfamily N-acetyltransferase
MIEFRCEPLGKQHDRQRFRCESPELEAWLKQRGLQDRQRHIAAVNVLVPCHEPTRIAGFYSLSATAILLGELPEPFARKLPRYPLVPAVLIGRLARDIEFRGIGDSLLMDAIERVWRWSKEIAAAAIVVDAKNDRAQNFYIRHGFQPFPGASERLFLPMATVEKTVRF